MDVRTLLLLVAAAANLSSVAAADAKENECQPTDSNQTGESAGTCLGAPCTLYLAPSSLPGAGLGVYTSVDIPAGSTIGSLGGVHGEDDEEGGAPPLEDLFVPVEDTFKTLPYRGQQRFMSWLGYVWPEEIDAFYPSRWHGSFPKIPESFHRLDEGLNAADGVEFYITDEDEDQRVSAFAPGIASMVNSHQDLANVEKVDESEREDYAGLDDGDAADGSFTPHYGVSFRAMDDIAAGSELFIDYGDDWHERFDRKLEQLRGAKDKWEARDKAERKGMPKWLPSEARKRRRMERMGDEVNKLVGGAEINRTRIPGKRAYTELATDEDNAFDDIDEEANNWEDDDKEEEEEEGEEPENEDYSYHDIEEEETIQSIDWLTENGMCVDNLRAAQSKVEQAGRGAFVQKFIPNGSVIAPAPLLVLKREDLAMYEADESEELFRNVLNLDKVVGQELLLNYCFGHPDSPLLLLPYSPIVNFINHNADAPNAEIRWPSKVSPFYPGSRDWLSMHPLDVHDHSGKLMMEFVALRDIQPGEEILIDYGRDWEKAWKDHFGESEDTEVFRHEIGVPEYFFPHAWKHASSTFEVAPIEPSLAPGELSLIRWAHNGEPVAKNLYRAVLPRGFSASIREYSDRMGFSSLYEKLLNEEILDNDEFQVFEKGGEQWFAHRYMSTQWKFNMHYIAAWDENARQSLLGAHGKAGFDVVLEGTAKLMGLTNMTCFHSSFMGVSECDNSFTHADVYSTGEKGFNYIFPVVVVNGSAPELDVQSDDFNVVVGVNYEYDVAYALGDWVYHKTRAIEYADESQIRIVVATYCSQIDADNAKMTANIYDGEDPAPFMKQFKLPLKEAHWGNGNKLPNLDEKK